MKDKNIFLQKTNKIKNKEYFDILFQEKNPDKPFINFDKFNDKLKEFIKIQKNNNEIDLSFICFHEHFDFTNKTSSFNQILEELEILEYYEKTNKICSKIDKKISFAEAKFFKRVEFIRVTFIQEVSFEGTWFYSDVNFEQSMFKEEVIFEGIRCKKEAIFVSTFFEKKASFYRARFYDYSSFKDATFYDEVDFENTVSKDIFFFHNVKLGKISLIGSHLENANFLRLKDKDKKVLQKDNFQNKDSVRLIKAQYEKENNTTEVNWSFPLEQEFYLDLLKKEKSYYANKNINKISLLIYKYVSNYGTDWVRVLIVLFGFGFLASFGYSFLEKCQYFESHRMWFVIGIVFSILLYWLYLNIEVLFISFIIYYILFFLISSDLRVLENSIATLINPLNIFKQNKEYFENIVIYGIFVKAVVSTLIYQFVVSFRNSTKRK
jgi:uncharacterized protein YjbI with pentapeptide repeats